MRKFLAALLMLALPSSAFAQIVTTGNGPAIIVPGKDASGNASNIPVPAFVSISGSGTVAAGTPTGTAGSPNANVVTVQGIASGTVVPVSGTVNLPSNQNVIVANSSLSLSPNGFYLSSAATTNATLVKNSLAYVNSITATNTGAAVAFLKIYNKFAAPVVGTDVPALTIPIPANGSVSFNYSVNTLLVGVGGTGFAIAITNLGTDADATAVAAGQVKVALMYT